MAVTVVKFAGGLIASGGGFIARFDSSGTYQPTPGNLVLFACPNDEGDTGGIFAYAGIAGWTQLVITDPPFLATFFTPNVIWKIWDSGDSTTTVIDATFRNCYMAYEIGGIDPLNPINQCGYGGEQGGPAVAVQYTPAVAHNGSLALFLLYTQGRANFSLSPPQTYSDGFVYDGGATLPVTSGVGGMVVGAERASNTGDTLTATASAVPGGPFSSWNAAMPVFNPSTAPPPLDVHTISDTEEFVYQREGFTL